MEISTIILLQAGRLIYSSMEVERESLYHLGSSCKKTEVKGPTSKQSMRSPSSNGKYLSFITLLYLLTILGLILHGHQVFAGIKKPLSVFAYSLSITYYRLEKG